MSVTAERLQHALDHSQGTVFDGIEYWPYGRWVRAKQPKVFAGMLERAIDVEEVEPGTWVEAILPLRSPAIDVTPPHVVVDAYTVSEGSTTTLTLETAPGVAQTFSDLHTSTIVLRALSSTVGG